MYCRVKDSNGGRSRQRVPVSRMAVSRRLAKNMGGDIAVPVCGQRINLYANGFMCASGGGRGGGHADEDDMPLPALHVLLVERCGR